MIKLQDSLFTDITPENLASQLETQAFAYALGRQIGKLCTYAEGVHIYAAVDAMPERILDILAVELRTPAYRDSFSIEVKRALIKGTLTFYARMGTPAACNQIIETIFGSGYIQEWFDYDGNAHHFRAYVGQDGGQIDPGDLEEFRRVLGSVKRLSSWLDEVIAIASFDAEIVTFTSYLGTGYMETTLPEIAMEYPHQTVATAAGVFRDVMTTTLPEVQLTFSGILQGRGAFCTITTTALPAAE